MLVHQFNPAVVPVCGFGHEYGNHNFRIKQNKGNKPDMLCFDVTNLQNAFKHKQRKESTAEISQFCSEQCFIGGRGNTYAVVRKVYKEDRDEKKGMVNILLLLGGNKEELKKKACNQCG